MTYDLLRQFAKRRRTEARLAQEAALYHGTPRKNLLSILRVGLMPMVGKETKDVKGSDAEAHVSLTSDPKVAKEYAGKSSVVLAVDSDHPDVQGKFVPDSGEKKSVMTNIRIPPEAISVKETDELSRRIQKFMDIGHQFAAANRERIRQGSPHPIDPLERPIPSDVHDAFTRHGYDYVGRDIQDGMHHYVGNGHDVYYQSHPDAKNGSIWYHHSFQNPGTEGYGDDDLKLHLDATHAKLESKKPACPYCGSTDYGLMPPDFETAKCHKCGKNWNHGIVPGVNDLSGAVTEAARSLITHDSLTRNYGFQDILTTNAGKFGSVTRYLHPLGHNLILTSRLKKGRERVRHTTDPGQWDHQWTFVDRSGQTTSGHTLRSLYDQFQTTTLK